MLIPTTNKMRKILSYKLTIVPKCYDNIYSVLHNQIVNENAHNDR